MRDKDDRNVQTAQPSVDPDTALSYIPVLLLGMDNDDREMFAKVMQAMREGGYKDGFRDGAHGSATRSILVDLLAFVDNPHLWKDEDRTAVIDRARKLIEGKP